MPKILKFKGLTPKIHKDSFIAHGAVIAGDVTIAEHSGIWFNCVVRGDVNPVTIGSGTNIQDGTIVHTSRFDGPTFIGNNITIGHLALVLVRLRQLLLRHHPTHAHHPRHQPHLDNCD